MRLLAAHALWAVLLALATPGLGLAQSGAALAVQAPPRPPAVGATFTTSVTISRASDVLGFQFDVEFDPAVLAVTAVELGPFLAGAGRQALPLGPDLRAAANGKVTFGGYTLGPNEQAGGSGDGVLAVITWRALQAGASPIALRRPLLAGAGGASLPVVVSDPVTVVVAGNGRWQWLGAGLLAAAALAGALTLIVRQRRRRNQS